MKGCNPSRLLLPARCAIAALAISLPLAAAQADLPKIRTSPSNAVPRCVTPERLMAFLKLRNKRLAPAFANIAHWYKHHGESWRVRWDYAFFQMAVETNFLTYRRGNGRWGDVDPRQNNFAGLGTTGGGVPGDSYPDVNTGVLAQIQHLVVYSGQRIANPVGPRTKLKQEHILKASARAQRALTFADLSGRWAADRHYSRSIEWVAANYRKRFCRGRADAKPVDKKTTLPSASALGGPARRAPPASAAPVRTIWSRADVQQAARVRARPEILQRRTVQMARQEPLPQPAAVVVPVPQPAEQPKLAFAAGLNRFAWPSKDSSAAAPARVSGCKVDWASYGGHKTLLVRSRTGSEVRYTALTVLEGFERSMLESFVKANAPGGSSVGEFATKDAALAKAKQLCPEEAAGPRQEAASAG
jgi:hypothetical protein